MPDYADTLRYGLTLALLAAYALMCLTIWQRHRHKRLAAAAEAACAMQAAGLAPSAHLATSAAPLTNSAAPESAPVLVAWAKIGRAHV